MKNLFTLVCMGVIFNTHAQYFQWYYNLDFATPQYRDEVFNSGIRTVLNYNSGKPANYFMCGIGTSYKNAALPGVNSKADRLRFVRNKKDGTAVLNNYGYEFKDAQMNSFNSTGNSIAEIDNAQGTGGYIAVGAVASNPITGAGVPGLSDALFVNLGSTGMVVGAVRLDFGETTDIAWCVRRSVYVPGTFLVCGQSGALSGDYTNCFVARIEMTGIIIWAYSYNFDPTPTPTVSAHCTARQLCEDPKTGNIYVAGTLRDVAASINTDGLAFALNSTGGVLWARNYHAAKDDEFKAIRFTSDGNLIVGGHTNYKPAGAGAMTNMLLTKLKASNGVIIWQTILRATGATPDVQYNSKCFDVTEGLSDIGKPVYYLVGPVYTPGFPRQLMYKTDDIGTGINNYQYNSMKIDSLFGIDLDNSASKPGVVIASSAMDPTSGFSDAHLMKTYHNGATCKDYCPANPPLNLVLQLSQPRREYFIQQQVIQQQLNSKRYAHDELLQCNQSTVACGALQNSFAMDEAVKTNLQKATIFPNPVRSILNVNISDLPAGKYNIAVNDVAGRMMLNKPIQADAIKIVQVDVSRLPAGMYMLTIEQNGTRKRVSFVKE